MRWHMNTRLSQTTNQSMRLHASLLCTAFNFKLSAILLCINPVCVCLYTSDSGGLGGCGCSEQRRCDSSDARCQGRRPVWGHGHAAAVGVQTCGSGQGAAGTLGVRNKNTCSRTDILYRQALQSLESHFQQSPACLFGQSFLNETTFKHTFCNH